MLSQVSGILLHVFLQFKMRVWWILVILSILLIVIVLIKNRKINQLYDDYTKDVIHEWTWRWQWNGGLFSLHELENLMAIFPICETQLTIKLKVSQNDRTNLSTLGNERTFIERGFHRDDPYAAPGFMCVRCGYGKIARSLPDFHDVKVWILAEVEERKRKMYVK